jgi:hypothetical protein
MVEQGARHFNRDKRLAPLQEKLMQQLKRPETACYYNDKKTLQTYILPLRLA